MLILICEVAMFSAGIRALVKNEAKIGKTKLIRGPRARVWGTLMCMPVPVAIAAAVIHSTSAFGFDLSYLWGLEVSSLIVFALAALIVGRNAEAVSVQDSQVASNPAAEPEITPATKPVKKRFLWVVPCLLFVASAGLYWFAEAVNESVERSESSIASIRRSASSGNVPSGYLNASIDASRELLQADRNVRDASRFGMYVSLLLGLSSTLWIVRRGQKYSGILSVNTQDSLSPMRLDPVIQEN